MVLAPVNTGVRVVAGVEEAAELWVEVDVGVHFVPEEGWLMTFDDAEEDSGFKIVGAKDFWGERGN